jgi:hypothetical protein
MIQNFNKKKVLLFFIALLRLEISLRVALGEVIYLLQVCTFHSFFRKKVNFEMIKMSKLMGKVT